MEIITSILTLVIALIAVYIAWQQWNTNRTKLKFDLFNRRFKIYEEIISVLSLILRDGTISNMDILLFRQKVSEASFLFDSNVIKLIEEIFKHGMTLNTITIRLKDKFSNMTPDERDNLVDKVSLELEWFEKQFEVTKTLFTKYLAIKN